LDHRSLQAAPGGHKTDPSLTVHPRLDFLRKTWSEEIRKLRAKPKSNINWNSPAMRQHGQSIRQQIQDVHVEGVKGIARIHAQTANILLAEPESSEIH
jgi:hypothetical protein